MRGLSVITVSPISKILQKFKMFFLYHAGIQNLFFCTIIKFDNPEQKNLFNDCLIFMKTNVVKLFDLE